jgi:hypothetical protein
METEEYTVEQPVVIEKKINKFLESNATDPNFWDSEKASVKRNVYGYECLHKKTKKQISNK